MERRNKYSPAERAAIKREVAKRRDTAESLIYSWRTARWQAEKIASEPLTFISYGGGCARRRSCCRCSSLRAFAAQACSHDAGDGKANPSASRRDRDRLAQRAAVRAVANGRTTILSYDFEIWSVDPCSLSEGIFLVQVATRWGVFNSFGKDRTTKPWSQARSSKIDKYLNMLGDLC